MSASLPKHVIFLILIACLSLNAGLFSVDQALAAEGIAGGNVLWRPSGFLPPAELRPGLVPRPLVSNSSLKLLGGLGAVAWASTSFQDHRWAARVLDTEGLLDLVLDLGDGFGDGGGMAALTLASYFHGRLTGSARTTAISGDLGRAMLGTWGAVWVLKIAVDAKRPNGGAYSFPSGHTATAFASATVLGRHCGRRSRVALLALATATGLARMEDSRHHLSDVLFGAALGTAIGHEAISVWPDRFTFDGLMLGPNRLGVSFRF